MQINLLFHITAQFQQKAVESLEDIIVSLDVIRKLEITEELDEDIRYY